MLFWGISLFLSSYPSFFWKWLFKRLSQQEKARSASACQKKLASHPLPYLALAGYSNPGWAGAAGRGRCAVASGLLRAFQRSRGTMRDGRAGGPSLCTITSAPCHIRRGAAPPRCPVRSGAAAAWAARLPAGSSAPCGQLGSGQLGSGQLSSG